MQGEEHYQAWGKLIHSIRTGESSFESLYRMPMFEYYAQNPEPAQVFHQSMTNFSQAENEAIVNSYDFSKMQTVIDVAGGEGGLLMRILKANSHLDGVLFELAGVIEAMQSNLEITERCRLIAGNFLAQIPTGGDVYLLKRVIHNWEDDKAIAILRNCRQAMRAKSKVLVIEQVIPPGNDPFFGKLLDLKMLVLCSGGQERTQSQYQQLFEQAGLKLTQVISTSTTLSLIEGVAAS
jgi:hypothetical protein